MSNCYILPHLREFVLRDERPLPPAAVGRNVDEPTKMLSENSENDTNRQSFMRAFQ